MSIKLLSERLNAIIILAAVADYGLLVRYVHPTHSLAKDPLLLAGFYLTLLVPAYFASIPIAFIFLAAIRALEMPFRFCPHAVPGARNNKSLCVDCAQEQDVALQKRQEQERLSQEREILRQEAYAKQRAEDEEKKRQVLECLRRLEYLQQMDPNHFQLLVWTMYRNMGWIIEETPFSRDGGVDGFIVKGSVRIALQCKRYSGSVTSEAIQRLHSAYLTSQANSAIMVTTGTITQPAREVASNTSIEVVDGERLVHLLDTANLTADLIPDDFIGKPRRPNQPPYKRSFRRGHRWRGR